MHWVNLLQRLSWAICRDRLTQMNQLDLSVDGSGPFSTLFMGIAVSATLVMIEKMRIVMQEKKQHEITLVQSFL